MMDEHTAISALYKYMYAAGAYAEMSNAELAAELLKLWATLPSRHPLCALISEVIERLDPSSIDVENDSN